MTRQQKWQEKQISNGKCKICGKDRSLKNSRYCEKHRIDYLISLRKTVAKRELGK